jgi:hypothetical protein
MPWTTEDDAFGSDSADTDGGATLSSGKEPSCSRAEKATTCWKAGAAPTH